MKTTFAALFLVSTFLSIVADAGQIKVCAAAGSEPVAGAYVKCWDDDYNSDDFMTDGTTDLNGCVTLNYQTKTTSWWWPGYWWDSYSSAHPDIFCEVSGDCIRPTNTWTKNNHNQNYLANFGTVNVVADAAFCSDSTWNGCGPDLPDWLSDAADSVSGFQDACNSHDVCYGNCGNTRKECEDEFWVDMYAQCDGSYLNYFCRVLADIFHAGTYTQGESFCIESRSDCTQAQQNSCVI
jgi:hypothetical protein